MNQPPYHLLLSALLGVLLGATACTSQNQKHTLSPAPKDPIAETSAKKLRAYGLAYARRGDFTRAQQYLGAAQLKGYEPSIIVPEVVKVCIAASRLRAALAYAEPYLADHPEDAGMDYVVGTIHLALGNLGLASRHLGGALQAPVIMVDAAFSLAIVKRKQGKVAEAIEHLQRYLNAKPRGRYATRAKYMMAELVAEQNSANQPAQLVELR